MSLIIPDWDEYFMRHVYLASSKSKDDRTRIGAVIVRNKRVISEGYNGLPQKLKDNIKGRNESPEKHFWYEHGERNAIYGCSLHGISTLGTTLYTQGLPCAPCMRAIIQAGIQEIVIHKQWDKKKPISKDPSTSSRRGLKYSRIMAKEANVKIRVFDSILGVKGMSDGVIYDL